MQGIVKRVIGLVGGLGLMCTGLAGCGAPAPDWTFTDAGGEVRRLSDYRGGIVVLAFSNTWCDSCHKAALHLEDLQRRFSDRGVRVVFVSSYEHGDAMAYMQEHGYNYGLILDGTEIAREYNVDRIPTFYVIGVDGRLLYRHEGFDKGTSARLASVINRHLKAHGGKVGTHVAQH